MYDKSAQFRFYEELNDFLPEHKKKTEYSYTFHGMPAVKDAIEAEGVPHTEVDLILVNGKSVGFDYSLQHDDRVSVYPVFETLDISPIVRLREKPLRESKFILDVHLGKLSKLLRMLGFDSSYRNDYSDPEIVNIALKEKRIILTRDRGILKINVVTHGYCIRSKKPKEQISEVLNRFDLFKQIKPFYRCMLCNGKLDKVDQESIQARLLPKTAQYYTEFYKCLKCDKIYWKGSHYEKMNNFIQKITGRESGQT